MKMEQPYTHPMNLYNQRIKEEGIVVFDDVRGMPTGDEPFISPDYVIAIGHRGRIELMYDNMPDYSEKHTVGVIFPDHCVCKVEKTDDYLATLIIVDSSVLNDPMLQIIKHLRYRYEPHPCVKLEPHEYRMIVNVVDGMREIVRLNMPDRRMLMSRLLEFLLRLLSQYRHHKLNDDIASNRISAQFHSDLSKHFRQHREVGFYAKQACLSPKYFSTVIKQETGYAPTYWIYSKIVSEAKMLLHIRRDLTVQAIAYMLGFDEQAAFTRFFRRETGMSPTEFRERKE